MKKYLIITLIALFGCDKKDGPGIIDTGFSLELVSSDLRDLLDPSNNDSYKHSGIRIFPDIYDLENSFYNPSLDAEFGYTISKEGNMDYYYLNLGTSIKETKPFLLKLSNSDIDTILCEVNRRGESLRTDKIWYNGELKWNSDSQTPKVIRIIKE